MQRTIYFPRIKNMVVETYPELSSLVTFLNYSKLYEMDKIVATIENVMTEKKDRSLSADFVERIARAISYSYGIYFELFGLTDKENFEAEILRQLKMRISPPIVKVPTSLLKGACTPESEIWCICCGIEGKAMVLINPFERDYELVDPNSIPGKISFFNLNIPGFSRPSYITDGNNRFNKLKKIL
ncbi:hypothetical protein E0485_11975 [Paenibacillus albiflavus]|uniref:Uncharacterized protein n=1 Tax=Paenibacillus albiflavus TaxID=2545760 RepID=A0A4V2WNX5_9BACL|nr:hypothetical protein [Paenibacillus albiflavus]TCZ77172.1 hypothetical protein E0485_11975 [Paenibacillus albiflavus]